MGGGRTRGTAGKGKGGIECAAAAAMVEAIAALLAHKVEFARSKTQGDI